MKRPSRGLAALMLLCGALGCGDRLGCRESPGGRDAGITDVRPFVPLSAGDRWRLRVAPRGRIEHVGVSAIDAAGHAIVHGTDRASIQIVESSPEGAWVVSPEGARLVPLLVAPLRVGAITRYTTRQGEQDGRCELEVLALDAREPIAGRTLAGCVRQRRVCRLPAGGGLPRPTTFTNEETRCPGVGLVRDALDIDPPLPFEELPSRRESRLVAFHVRGGPVMQSGVDPAERLILLPSDVNAACGGTTLRSELRTSATTPIAGGIPALVTPPDARPTDSLQAFELRDGVFVIETRAGEAAALAQYVGSDAIERDGALVAASPTRRTGLHLGGLLVRITPTPGCSDAAVARLAPLLRSMLE